MPSTSLPGEPGPRRLLALISATQLLAVLDGTAVTIALPRIQRDLELSSAGLAWVLSAYALAFGALLLPFGRAGDLLGRRRVLVAGAAMCTAASLAGALAPSGAWLIAARVAQGAGAAVAMPAALALVTTGFAAGPARTRAFTLLVLVSGLGGVLGMVLGGALTAYGWRWTLLLTVPLGLATVALVPTRLPGEDPAPATRPRGPAPSHTLWSTLTSASTAVGGLVALLLALSRLTTRGWTDPGAYALLGLAGLLLAVFVRADPRSPRSLLPYVPLRDRDRLAVCGTMFAMGAALLATTYGLTLFVQDVLGYGPLRAGIAFLPSSLGLLAAAPLAAHLSGRMPARLLGGFGGIGCAAGMGWLALAEPGTHYVTGLLGPMTLIAVCRELAFVPLTLAAMDGVESGDAGGMSAVLNTMLQVGGALGVAVLSALPAQPAFAAAAATTAAAAGLVLLSRRGRTPLRGRALGERQRAGSPGSADRTEAAADRHTGG
ncbi:MFS transporter [Actinopolymorpha singaporensis]|uniref:Major Facilitator Superfamily protein n=1 Tax=Actinopolymorpha singaporensis TaxID=117157 RepID=A0A1H1L136_9ACTN|nr:MFS transporter [Actinopolymorpha singaporensis]SDR68097.1 Major Facilitator Superfamily protein [Actinopolymorpha singaporensis]